jgi:pimeloyl-ACP methyl ester carboxylesterase
VIPVFDKKISADGIAYLRCGSCTNPSLLLIHGVGLCAESWYPLIDPLAEHFDLIVIDLPGHGKSQPLKSNFESVNLNDYLEAIERFSCTIGLQDFLVCGHSLGALLATEIAAKHSNRVMGLAALNTVYQRSDRAAEAVKQRAVRLSHSDSVIGVDETIERWFTEAPKPEMLDYARLCEHWLRTNSLSGYAMAYKTFADQRGPSKESMQRIDCDSIFMTGALDSNSSPEMTALLKSTVRGSNAFVVEGAAHMMPLTHWRNVLVALIELKQRVVENQCVQDFSQAN